jgi:hypothetical protein
MERALSRPFIRAKLRATVRFGPELTRPYEVHNVCFADSPRLLQLGRALTELLPINAVLGGNRAVMAAPRKVRFTPANQRAIRFGCIVLIRQMLTIGALQKCRHQAGYGGSAMLSATSAYRRLNGGSVEILRPAFTAAARQHN